jgi:hypothetical protein
VKRCEVEREQIYTTQRACQKIFEEDEKEKDEK